VKNETPSDIALPAEHTRPLTGLRELATVLRDGGQPDTAKAIEDLAREAREHLQELWRQALSVADANAGAIELVEQQMRFNEELKQQNLQLREQKQQIDKALKELESQAAAMAEANVDALLQAEESGAELRKLTDEQRRLQEVNQELASRTKELEEEAKALAAANVDAVTMMEEKEQSISQLESRTSALEMVRRELEDKAFRDSLTGLYNNRYFNREMALEFERARRHRRNLTLLFLDIDHFKRINDTYGHQTGDKVLETVGTIMLTRIRNIDVAVCVVGAPFAARYGGEEFVAILPETSKEEGVIVAERIREAIAERKFESGGDPMGPVTLSAGVATLSEDDKTPEDLIGRADKALYAAKEGGRNRVVTAD